MMRLMEGEWDPARVREALKAFMAQRKLKIQPWAKRARLAESTLRNFLKGLTRSLTQRSLEQLAAAERVTVAEMLGETSSTDNDVATVETLDSALMFNLISSLERYLEKWGMVLTPDRKAHAVLDLYRKYLARRSQVVDFDRHREDIRRLAEADLDPK